jgi:periplasmic copper chaperone A
MKMSLPERLRICRLPLLLISLLSVALAQDPAIVVRNAWVRAIPPSKTETALYVVLENHTAQRRDIVSGSTDIADKVELHEMKMNRAVMTMTRVAKVTIPARGKVEFDPGSLHVMLFGLRKKLAVGDTVTVTLMLDDGTAVPVAAKVKKE